jgi:hypothetical protein
MRCAESHDLADFFVSFAQIGIVVAQAVVVEGGRPVSEHRYQEQKKGDQQSANAKRPGAGNIDSDSADRSSDRRFSEGSFRKRRLQITLALLHYRRRSGAGANGLLNGCPVDNDGLRTDSNETVLKIRGRIAKITLNIC